MMDGQAVGSCGFMPEESDESKGPVERNYQCRYLSPDANIEKKGM
jgi:hypothetical protein